MTSGLKLSRLPAGEPQDVRVGLEMGHIIFLIISQAAPFISEVRGATCAILPGSLYGVISH